MSKQVSNICRAGWACIRRIGKIRKYLDEPSTEKLAHAFITSRIDSCNSLLLGLPEKEIQRLQRLQNATARLVCLVKRIGHITPILYKLHWLPVCQRIKIQNSSRHLQMPAQSRSKLPLWTHFSLSAQTRPSLFSPYIAHRTQCSKDCHPEASQMTKSDIYLKFTSLVSYAYLEMVQSS